MEDENSSRNLVRMPAVEERVIPARRAVLKLFRETLKIVDTMPKWAGPKKPRARCGNSSLFQLDNNFCLIFCLLPSSHKGVTNKGYGEVLKLSQFGTPSWIGQVKMRGKFPGLLVNLDDYSRHEVVSREKFPNTNDFRILNINSIHVC